MAAFSLKLPSDWFEIELGEQLKDHALATLVRQRVGHHPDLAPVRHAARALLSRVAGEVRRAGCQLLAATAFELPDPLANGETDVVAATLSVSEVCGASEFDGEMIGRLFADQQVDAVELPAGPAVRIASPADASEAFTVQYFICRPAGELMVLNFASPNCLLRESLERFFAAVAETFEIL